MLTLPVQLGAVAKMADPKNNNPRFAGIHGVLVGTTPDGWEAVATDTKRAVRVTGPHPADSPALDYQNLADAPNGATSAVVPARWWADLFAAGKKAKRPVGVALSERVATASTGTATTQTQTLEGRFPPVEQFMPKRRDDVACEVTFDAAFMAGTLKALAELSDDAEHLPLVTLEVRRPNGPRASDKPILLRVVRPADGVGEVVALVMPAGACDDNGQSTKIHDTPEVTTSPSDRAEGDERAAGLERHVRDLTAECERLRAEAEAVRAERDAATARYGELQRERDELATRLHDIHRRLTATDGAGESLPLLPRRTLGQLAAVRKGGA